MTQATSTAAATSASSTSAATTRSPSNMIVGALVQFDWAKDDSGVLASKVDGNGWMIGPYLSARIHENIYLDLRAAWGRSSNDSTLGYDDRRASIPRAGW